MKKKTAVNQAKQPKAQARSNGASRVHPVIIYPYRQPNHYHDLDALFELIARLDAAPETYARPITVMDRKTFSANSGSKEFNEFRRRTVEKHSDILDAWCVDTCQMWCSGLGMAYERGAVGDAYWLIPGDFNYGSDVGKVVLGRLHDLPEIVEELGQDICIGEIATDHNNPKQLIDDYGTFALLYNWFPTEARAIREMTERPRSEFFSIGHDFLGEVLRRRWYAYEQTMVMLLHAVFGHRQISRFFVGNISDLPEGRESVASALQQVERTERVLKTLWQERNHSRAGWIDHYRELEARSDQIRRSAVVILNNLLAH